MILLFLTALFLIVLVLIQRGKGGGLAGAFGGMGGQSAFGTKAGDLFTRITIGVAAFWIVLCIDYREGARRRRAGRCSQDMGGTAGIKPAATAPARPTSSRQTARPPLPPRQHAPADEKPSEGIATTSSRRARAASPTEP